MTDRSEDLPPASPEPSDGKSMVAVDVGVMALLAVVAFFLRRPGLAPASLHYDDAWVALVHRLPLSDLPTVDTTTPGFTLALKAWLSVVGYSDLRVQVPMVVAGIVGPALIYRVLRPRISWPLAATAGVLLAFAPLHIEYSVRVKQYTVEVLFAVVLSALAWWVVDRPDERRRWVAMTAVASIAVVTSFTTVIVVAGCLAAGALAVWRHARPRWTVAAPWIAAFGGFSLVWYRLVIHPDIKQELVDFWRPNYIVTSDGVGEMVSSWWSLTSRMVEGLSPLPPTLTAILLVAAAVALVPRAPEIVVLTVVPYVVLVGLALTERAPLGGGRTDIFLYPSLIILLVTGADAAASWVRTVVPAHSARPAAVPAAAVAVVLAASTVAWADTRAEYPAAEMRPLLGEMARHWNEGDVILLPYGGFFHYALYTTVPFDVHSGPVPYGVEFHQRDLVPMPYRASVEDYLPFVDEANRGERIWLLVAHPVGFDTDGVVNAIAERTGRPPVLQRHTRAASLTLFE